MKIILHVATTCSCLAVRGTCFYALGLISSTRSAARALQNLGWECKKGSFICVPMSIKQCKVFQMKDCGTESLCIPPIYSVKTFGDARDELIKHFINLSCKIAFDKSLNAIKALKAQQPEIFQDHEVQYQIFRIMERYQYPLPPRRFFITIFDVFWSQEKLESLPSCDVTSWPFDNDGFAYFPPVPSGNWANIEKSQSLRRNSFRGPFGMRRASVVCSYFLFFFFM